MNRRSLRPTNLAWGLVAAISLSLLACTREPPPRTVTEFVENPRLLEGAMLRCAENRLELKYTQECINAREAVNRIAAQEDAARRENLEQQSTRKREALRRSREAAEAARAQAEELERQRREAEYLGQFETLPEQSPDDMLPAPPQESAALPAADGDMSSDLPPPAFEPDYQPANEPGVATDSDIAGENPGESSMPLRAESPADGNSLESVREELQRRQEEADNQ